MTDQATPPTTDTPPDLWASVDGLWTWLDANRPVGGREGLLLHTYNHHRSHTALGGQPPITRVNNAAGQYT